MFFELEKLNPNNQKQFVKTIEYNLQYVMYVPTTTAIANLISLDNIGPRVKSHSHYSLRLSGKPWTKKGAWAKILPPWLKVLVDSVQINFLELNHKKTINDKGNSS